MLPRLDISADGGRTWQVYRYGYWQSVTMAPQRYATFYGEQFEDVRGGYTYRTAMWFYWYVGTTRVGQVLDVFNHGADDTLGDASAAYSRLSNGCYLR